jgi:hypothetical protein
MFIFRVLAAGPPHGDLEKSISVMRDERGSEVRNRVKVDLSGLTTPPPDLEMNQGIRSNCLSGKRDPEVWTGIARLSHLFSMC